MLVIQGVIFVTTVLLFRRGIVGEIIETFRRRTNGSAPVVAAHGAHS